MPSSIQTKIPREIKGHKKYINIFSANTVANNLNNIVTPLLMVQEKSSSGCGQKEKEREKKKKSYWV